VALGACSGGPDDGPAGAGTPAAGSASSLSPDYLAGQWCYRHHDSGGQREDQGISYLFRPDGTLLDQNTPAGPVDRPGRFTVDAEDVAIEPTFAMLDLKVQSASNDRFILRGMGGHQFVRGACG
jgi:hypothetical protein